MKFISSFVVASLFFGVSAFGRTKTAKYSARLAEYKYPFEVKNFTFISQKQKLEMAYMDLSTNLKSSKKVVVLLHGKNFAGFYWERIVKGLIKKGYRVIVPDQIGFGKSSKPAAYQHSFPQMAINTKKLLSSLRIDEFEVVGHSMGGMLATTMAYMYDQNVKKLVLINPIGLEPYLDYVEFKDTDFFYKNELGKTREKVISYQRKNYYAGKWKPEYEALIEAEAGLMNGSDWEKVAWNNALTYGPIFSENLIPRIKNLRVPTTLLIGTRDSTGPGRGWKKPNTKHKLGQYDKFGRDFKKWAPRSKVIEFDGLGHMPQFEDYPRFSKKFYPLFD